MYMHYISMQNSRCRICDYETIDPLPYSLHVIVSTNAVNDHYQLHYI